MRAWSRCSDIGQRLNRWLSLTARERWTLLACAPALAVIHSSLATVGYRRTRRWLEAVTRHPSPRPATPAEITQAQSLAGLASIAGRHGMVEATCMRQSLLLYAWLRKRGLQPVLNLGISKDIAALQASQPFHAHAWVELEGTALLPSDTAHVAFGSHRTDDDPL